MQRKLASKDNQHRQQNEAQRTLWNLTGKKRSRERAAQAANYQFEEQRSIVVAGTDLNHAAYERNTQSETEIGAYNFRRC